MLLALESSCDETAAAVCDGRGRILASQVVSQIMLHREFGGVVPEAASRQHVLAIRPLLEATLAQGGLTLGSIDVFAATAGPGLASSLLVGNTLAKALALAAGKPFLAVNHLEGHLLSPYMGDAAGIRPGIGLIASGGHSLLARVLGPGHYELLGQTRDDAAGEAFDKGARLLGLPYPGGPALEKLAREGNPKAHPFPRAFPDKDQIEFSFSGLKTALRYLIPKLNLSAPGVLPDVCASYQEAIVSVLVEKTIQAAQKTRATLISASGGVTCNARFRDLWRQRASEEGLESALAAPDLCTDNAAMIAHAAFWRARSGLFDDLDTDVNPSLPLVPHENRGF